MLNKHLLLFLKPQFHQFVLDGDKEAVKDYLRLKEFIQLRSNNQEHLILLIQKSYGISFQTSVT